MGKQKETTDQESDENSDTVKEKLKEDLKDSPNYYEGKVERNDRIVFKHWNDLIQAREKDERDTTYSSIWVYRKGKMIPPFVDKINKENPYYSEFNPLVSQNITNFWCDENDVIIDPFAGRTRGIVSGLTHRKYYGFEISKQVYDNVQEVLKEGTDKFDKGFFPIIYNDDSFNIDTYKDIPQADLIFSSPPYWNLEKYPSCNGQLSDIDKYDEFLMRLKKIMEKCCDKLKDNGYIVLVIGDFRVNKGNRLLSMDADVSQMMESIYPIVLWDKITLQNNNFGFASMRFGAIKHKRITSKVSEYILVFKKLKG